MTFQPTSQNNKITRQQDSSSSQSGVTLLLSILVLSAIVAISFSFASIILTEIRSSGDVARTEPAYYAVEGVVEQTIFKIKRSIPPNSSDPSNTYNFDFGSCNSDSPVNTVGANVATLNIVGLKSGICNQSPDADVKAIVPPTAGSTDNEKAGNTKNIYNVYDPNNPYTNTYTISGTAYPSAYSKVEFDYLDSPGGNSKIYFCAADADCFASGGWSTKTLSPGTRQIIYDANSGPSISPDKAYQFFVVNESTTQEAGIEIKSWGPDPQNGCFSPGCSIAKGLPSFAQYTVDVTATSLGLTRKYEVSIPKE